MIGDRQSLPSRFRSRSNRAPAREAKLRRFDVERLPLSPPVLPLVRLSPAARPAALTTSSLLLPLLHAVEGAVVGSPTATPLATPLATLLSRHVIRDGELILLILKPSRWYIALSSMRFTAVVLILLIGMHLRAQSHMSAYIEAGVFCIAGRLMWGSLNWVGRLYILTDQRIVRLSGVFNIEIFDCTLRKVARTRLVPTFRERLLRLGSIEILPTDESRPCGVWQTIPRPTLVNEEINAAIRRAKTGQA